MTTLAELRRIAEVEFSTVVACTDILSEKLRIVLVDNSFVDVWLSRKLANRFGFHWERRHLDGTIYRYDNFPDVAWREVPTYPAHFHEGAQEHVTAAPFSLEPGQGFRDFMVYVRGKMQRGQIAEHGA